MSSLRIITLGAALVLGGCGDDGGVPPPVTPPPDIDALARPLIDDEWTVGMTIGILRPDGSTEVYGYGAVEAGGAVPTATTLFEIGSISKTFTSLALADMVLDGAVTLDQPVQELLPAAEVMVPAGATPITLMHLSTHTSGLPRMPTNFMPADATDPYLDYAAVNLYEFLNGHTLAAEPGAQYEYSNVAVGLLGHALSRTDGTSWEDQIISRIAEPLGLADTRMTLSADQEARFARGHDGDRNPVAAWGFDVLAPAGGLRSTTDDMLAYLAAQSGWVTTDLSPAMQSSHIPQFTISDTVEIGLAWHVEEGRYVWHNGGTGGFGTFVGFDQTTHTGVVVLANATPAQSSETLLGLALLRLVAGEPYTAPELPTTLAVPATDLERYTGPFTFERGPLEIALRDGALFVELPGQSPYRMYASAPDEFYLRVAIVRLSFTCDVDRCDSFLIDQPGVGTFTATRTP